MHVRVRCIVYGSTGFAKCAISFVHYYSIIGIDRVLSRHGAVPTWEHPASPPSIAGALAGALLGWERGTRVPSCENTCFCLMGKEELVSDINSGVANLPEKSLRQVTSEKGEGASGTSTPRLEVLPVNLWCHVFLSSWEGIWIHPGLLDDAKQSQGMDRCHSGTQFVTEELAFSCPDWNHRSWGDSGGHCQW